MSAGDDGMERVDDLHGEICETCGSKWLEHSRTRAATYCPDETSVGGWRLTPVDTVAEDDCDE